jgi:hypothetical protein
LRAATLVRDWVPILGINAGRLVLTVQKEDIDSFLQIVIDKNSAFTKSPWV